MQLPNLASPRLIGAITFTGVVAAVMLAASGAGGSPAKHAGAAASTVTELRELGTRCLAE